MQHCQIQQLVHSTDNRFTDAVVDFLKDTNVGAVKTDAWQDARQTFFVGLAPVFLGSLFLIWFSSNSFVSTWQDFLLGFLGTFFLFAYGRIYFLFWTGRSSSLGWAVSSRSGQFLLLVLVSLLSSFFSSGFGSCFLPLSRFPLGLRGGSRLP